MWQKSSFGDPAGNCVEVARADNGDVLVRDSADPKGAPLTFAPAEMDAFVRGVKAGEFDKYLLRFMP